MQQQPRLSIHRELADALADLDEIFVARRDLDKALCQLRHDLGRVQQRLINLANSVRSPR
jgi:hypothetical protein